jgi:hypothetical protein
MMPSDYINKLSAQAIATITADEWKRSDEIQHLLPGKPTSINALSDALETRPDLQAHLAWKTGYTPSKWLLENELDTVNERRVKHEIDTVDSDGDAYSHARKSGLMGICFSGGGIRSATFNLGILQGLAELKLLHCFDYLSSVSGGGYIHQWFAAWSKREGFNSVAQKLIPLPESGSPHSHPEPLRWLRRYSNYLTPEKGLFTADTWVAIATWLRNTILNQIILIGGLLFLVLLPQILTLHSLIPQRGPGAAIAIGAIVYLFLTATFFLGKNLLRFGGHPATDFGLFGQTGVQLAFVIPQLAAGLLFTLLLPIHSSAPLVNLVLSFLASSALLFALAVTIVFCGGAPLCYLQSHHSTSHYKSFSEFWHQKPKCKAHVKMIFVFAGLVAAALVASLCGAAWIALTEWWIAKLASYCGHFWWRLVLVIEPPLVLIGLLLTMILLLGFVGRTFENGRREWLARLGAWMGLYSLTWIGAVGLSLFGHATVVWLSLHLKARIGLLLTWAGTSLGGLLAGKSSRTAGTTDDKTPSGLHPMEILAIVAPYVFIVGLVLVLSALAEVILRGVHGHSWWMIAITFLAPLVICVLLALRVDINEFSMHAFYRDRLARCYLGASNAGRDANPLSGFDERDAQVAVSDLLPKNGYDGPFPIFCTALNLTFGEDLAWQERKAASFAFTPLYSGYDFGWTAAKAGTTNLRFNGFARTETYAYPQPGIHISTAAAISGAAMSPNWGYHSNPATAFLLTLFNVRLGWWLRNPRAVDENGKRLTIAKDDIRPKQESGMFRGLYPSPSPRFSLLYLISELLGQTNDTRQFVYLTDGGHFDNMGLYELVRRRCRYIVICDAEDDGKLTFEGIGMAIRKCRIDFGAEVTLDLRPLQHLANTEYSSAHCVVGTIQYQEDSSGEKPGIVVYVKSSLTGDEPGDVLNYKKEHTAFPHDTTANQWFTESQFESYRRLGHHVALSTFMPGCPDALPCKTIAGRTAYFLNLWKIWSAFTPEMKQFSAGHSALYSQLLQEVRTDPKLPGLFDMLFERDRKKILEWEKTTGVDADYGVRFSSKLIEFIFIVYLQLNLVYPENRNHPFAVGWMQIFQSWARIDVIKDAWLRYGAGYTKGFQIFAEGDPESNAIGLPKTK